MKAKNEDKLIVGSVAQRLIFLFEMKGQISDGTWENAKPNDHWMVWCNLGIKDVLMAKPGEEPHRNFYARRNYKFNDPELIGIPVIKERLILLVRLYSVSPMIRAFLEGGGDRWQIPQTRADWKKALEKTDAAGLESSYWREQWKKWELLGLNEEVYKEVEEYPYSEKDLVKDCKALSKAAKNYLPRIPSNQL